MSRKVKKKSTKTRSPLLDIFYPKGFSAKMGRIVAVLSILALINNSFHLGIEVTFRMLFMYYDDILRLLFSWADPFVYNFTQYISHIIHIRITISETWHHVFMVLWMLFMRDFSVAYSDGRIRLSTVRGISGFVIAIIFSFLATIEFGVTNNVIKNAQLAIVPYIGIYVYDLVMYAYAALVLNQQGQEDKVTEPIPSRWKYFKVIAVRAHWRFALILCTIGLVLAIQTFSLAPYPKGGLIILAIATVVNLLYWVFRGVLYARKARPKRTRHNFRSWYSLFLESEAGRFALAVGSVIIWTFTFVVLNEGAKLLGL
jgi:hypothetical protein